MYKIAKDDDFVEMTHDACEEYINIEYDEEDDELSFSVGDQYDSKTVSFLLENETIKFLEAVLKMAKTADQIREAERKIRNEN